MPDQTPPTPDVIIRPLDLARDAEALARMWRESDLAWPGSWDDGVPITADWVREFEADHGALVVFVAEVDGEIAGYCSFMEGWHGPKGEGYLSLLNVNPKFHGQSIGRRLIQATIERSVQEGFKRQTLGTWSANFKAVPAYKKTGHFWTPDTSVWMQNYIPGALQMPLAKPFFARHDWYRCYVREVKQEWDDQRWEGLKVFTQHWEADGEALTIWIDREARAPVAIETDGVLVAAIARDIEPLAGGTVELTWRVQNKGAELLPIFLHALGDKGLEIDHRDGWVVPAGETVERTAQVRVAADARAKKDDGSALAVRSVLRVGEVDLELFSGMRARRPLVLSTAPDSLTVRPGTPCTIRLQVHNEQDAPARLTLRLVPPPGLATDWTVREVEAPARGHAAVPLILTAEGEAVYSLPVRVEQAGEGAPKPLAETLSVFSLAPGGLLMERQGESVRVETDALRYNVAAKAGELSAEYKGEPFTLFSCSTRLGPPYAPSSFQDREFALEVEERGARVVVRLSAEDGDRPGLWLLQEITFSAAGLADMRVWMENRGAEAVTRRMRLSYNTPDHDALTVALPLGGGVVTGPGGRYPAAWRDAPPEPSAYAEPWLAWEYHGATGAIAWSGCVEGLRASWHNSVESVACTLAPGERSEALGCTFYGGAGGWPAARQALLGPEATRARAWQTRAPLEARLEPAVVATVGAEAEATLVVDSVSLRAETPSIALELEGGASASPAAPEVGRILRGAPARLGVTLRRPEGASGAGVYPGVVRLEGCRYAAATPLTLLCPGSARPVRVERSEQAGQEVWAMDNGAAEFVVAPGFGSSLIAWNVAGENHLYSPFPTPQGFSWMYPWFGGVYPQLFMAGSHLWEGLLYREKVQAAPVSVPDAQGLPWTGVRLSVRPEKKELHDFGVEVDYLTLGDSPVLKVVYRVRNLRPTTQRVQIGLSVAARLGAEPQALTGLLEGGVHRPCNYAGFVFEQPWAALCHEATGRTLLMTGREDTVALVDYGQHGRVLGAERELRLAGDEVGERTFYLVLAPSPEAARAYLPLRAL